MELKNFIKDWNNLKLIPSYTSWPKDLFISDYVWKKFREIANYTKKDGHEYAVSLYSIDSEIIVTPNTRGTSENVITRDNITVKFNQREKGYYEKLIYVNTKLILKREVKFQKIPKTVEIKYLFNVHTHPTQYGKYSFFSNVDMNTFLNSTSLVMGLLTDRLWLVCKTEKSISSIGQNGYNILKEINRQIFLGEDTSKLIRENLANWGLVFYSGNFSNKLLKK